jgi:hypothetical protein
MRGTERMSPGNEAQGKSWGHDSSSRVLSQAGDHEFNTQYLKNMIADKDL